jgi:hypothetical protein
MAEQGLTYAVDLVLVIDATGSMAPIIEMVKSGALKFHDDFENHMTSIGKHIDSLRVRVIAYRDFYADSAADSLVMSDFFNLPDDRERFSAFLNGIRAMGGGDEPETGLEEGTKQRQVIVLWTDASAHPLETRKGAKPVGYPADMPADINELTDMWEGQTALVHASFKRLLLFSPDVLPWTDIANNWENTLHYASKAGGGLGDKDYKMILDAIAQSV